MHKIEKLFDINIILMTLFSSLETLRDQKKVDLIYDMEATIPRELRGDSVVLLRLLTKMLTFIFKNTDRKEIVLSLGAPEDFLYEELISFKIKETNIAKEKILEFLETNVSKDLEILEGKIVYERDSDIHLDIPFKINELGYRRHYRLPDVSMLGKKVLLIGSSEKVSQSITKMFNYFLYKVDVGFDAFKRQGNDLTPYDILIVEAKLNTEEFEHIIARVQQNIPLKYVLLKDSHVLEARMISVSTNLIKPVTEESIYELIVSLFKNETTQKDIKSQALKNIVDLEKVLQPQKNDLNENKITLDSVQEENIHTMIESGRGHNLAVLNREVGEVNTKKMGLKYSDELENFLDIFDRSDLYFREIVNEKSINKIKEFCIDLEKHAKLIGAESMLKFADIVSLIFVYNKLDLLPIYPGKYHIELHKLIEEIKKDLRIK
ncbi:MAG: hypothetical protein KC427_05195 [Sulfurovum sp.]|uniref:hypothetical protein n=1 Tax=Sulfurovum sp. TaxID=1969726 RepID=UPI002867F7CD|nr:hypothetical protein [Sulfurovum sp.]MCO4845398.1 hypothetical protein [Sulfurovum sp.]